MKKCNSFTADELMVDLSTVGDVKTNQDNHIIPIISFACSTALIMILHPDENIFPPHNVSTLQYIYV